MNREQALCLLGVEPDATDKQITSAHRRLISTVHPDRCSGPEAKRLAQEATIARNVLLAPSEPARPPVPRAVKVDDDLLSRYVLLILERFDRHVPVPELSRLLHRDLVGARATHEEVVAYCTRVSEHGFLAGGAVRGLWDFHADGVRPIAPVDEPARPPAAEAGTQGPAPASEDDALAPSQLWAAVAAASLFGFGAVGCLGMVAGGGLGILEVLAAWVAGRWILGRADLSAGALARRDVVVPALCLLLLFLVFAYR
jgi:hypothetical protein